MLAGESGQSCLGDKESPNHSNCPGKQHEILGQRYKSSEGEGLVSGLWQEHSHEKEEVGDMRFLHPEQDAMKKKALTASGCPENKPIQLTRVKVELGPYEPHFPVLKSCN